MEQVYSARKAASIWVSCTWRSAILKALFFGNELVNNQSYSKKWSFNAHVYMCAHDDSVMPNN